MRISSICKIVLVLLVPGSVTRAQVTMSIRHFDEGNQLFLQGDYLGALHSYEQVDASGYVSGALFYNMGNAYYRLDQLGEAIRYYEKARRLTPEREELLHNISIAQSRTVDRFSQLPAPFWKPAWRSIVGFFGINGLLCIGLFFYLVLVVLIGSRIWSGEGHSWRRHVLSVSLVLGIVFLTMAYAASLESVLDRQAVIIVQETTLYEIPQDGTEAELDIHEGLLVDILREQDVWAEIRLPNGATGWVEMETLGEI